MKARKPGLSVGVTLLTNFIKLKELFTLKNFRPSEKLAVNVSKKVP